MELLEINWYIQPPVDFEHKEYLLYAFLQKVDQSYQKRVVSPYLLHMERVKNDMEKFKENIIGFRNDLNRVRYRWFDNTKLEGENNELVEVVYEIVDYSLPQIESRIELGKKICKKYNQVLW